MSGRLAVILFIALTAFCWGIYGPVIQAGQAGMDGGRLRPFICVGLAYFVIAVVVPVILLRMQGEAGQWTTRGALWSLAAGAAGAIGALGIILAFSFHGKPIYVMPLVFGLAPVVNTFITMYLGHTFKQAGPIFIAGLIIVAVGAVVVLLAKPTHARHKFTEQSDGSITVESSRFEDGKEIPETINVPSAEVLAEKYPRIHRAFLDFKVTFRDLVMVAIFIALTALCWGAYGPVLHNGQAAMQGSRLRPLIGVGLAYFLIAVVVPWLLIGPGGLEPDSSFKPGGTIMSLLGGAAGAGGALGIILAFNAGGKPVFVMPLVFGGAPVINSLTEIIHHGMYDQIGPLFYAGLILVIAGAVTVLLFAPKPTPHPAPEPA
jgi:hypothetical protein